MVAFALSHVDTIEEAKRLIEIDRRDEAARLVVRSVAAQIVTGHRQVADDTLRHAVHLGISPSMLADAIAELARAKGLG